MRTLSSLRHRRGQLKHRRLELESLEDRRVLATLGINVRFFADQGGQRGAEIQTIGLGESFFAEVQVQDSRDDPQGVIALPLNLSWDPTLFRVLDVTNLTSDGNPQLPSDDPLVTPEFPLQRGVSSFDATAAAFDPSADPGNLLDFFNLRGVRGAALPNINSGTAIGIGQSDPFSLLHFTAIGNSDAAPLTVNLDGSMSFADADTLDDVIGLQQTSTVAALANTVQATLSVVGGTVEGTKFNDLNGNGFRDTNDPGLAGIAIQLTPVDPAGDVQEVLTGQDGSFQFLDLDLGDYTVNEVVPAGSVATFPANDLYEVTIGADNPTANDLDFGNFTLVSLSGVKFNDADGDGVRDTGEDGVPGITIRLDVGNDGDESNDQFAVTAADGTYGFEDLGLGTYSVSEEVPTGFEQTLPTNGEGYTVTLVSGQDQTNLDFGNREIPPPAANSIAGFVYTDVDADGVFDANEFGVPGVTIELYRDSETTAIVTTTTIGDGSYRFSDLDAGTYRVVEIQPQRYGDVSITLGNVLPDGLASGMTVGLNEFSGIVLASEQSAIDYNFGEALIAVSKRMFLASTSVPSELAANVNLNRQVIQGTNSDDNIRVENLSDSRLRITVNNDVPVEVSPEQIDLVLIDAMSGLDSITYVGNQEDEFIRAEPSQIAVTTPSIQLRASSVEQISADGGGGNDDAVLRDSAQSEQLSASGSSVILSSPSNQRIEISNIATVEAISAIDDEDDDATIQAIDFALQLSGDWNRVAGN